MNDTMFIIATLFIAVFTFLMGVGTCDALKVTVKQWKDKLARYPNVFLLVLMACITSGGLYTLVYKIAEFNQWMSMY